MGKTTQTRFCEQKNTTTEAKETRDLQDIEKFEIAKKFIIVLGMETFVRDSACSR